MNMSVLSHWSTIIIPDSTGCLPHLIEKAVTKAQHRCEEHVTWDETRPLGPLGPLGWMARKVIIYIYIYMNSDI